MGAKWSVQSGAIDGPSDAGFGTRHIGQVTLRISKTVHAAGDETVQLAGAGFSARVTNHADVSPTSTMCQNALMGSVSTG